MGFSIGFDPPLAFISRQYGDFNDELQDLHPLWERFIPLMEQFETERFSSDGFGEWEPLAESTLRQKEAHGYPLDPLVRTGALLASLTDPGQAADVSDDRMTWGTDVDYAHFHQDGGTTPGRPPQRKVLDISVSQRRELQQAVIQYVNEAAARAFRSAA
jgi:phage gpG-like protein